MDQKLWTLHSAGRQILYHPEAPEAKSIKASVLERDDSKSETSDFINNF